jgi:hypothetical protein
MLKANVIPGPKHHILKMYEGMKVKAHSSSSTVVDGKGG